MGSLVHGCAQVSVPDARNVDIPAPVNADERREAVNERPDSVMYLPLGEDVLVPEVVAGDSLPNEKVGPFELRGEILASALQLILAEYDISIAFEAEEGLERRITVANLHGPLNEIVQQVCSLADLYCFYQNGALVVKEFQVFTVSLPPLGADADDTDFLENVAEGLGAILGDGGEEPVIDETTRTIIYSATQRTADLAERYFQRLRANTALVVYETYIWEVTLEAGNSTGIDWDQIETFGKFDASISIDGGVAADFTNPVSIGLPTTQNVGVTPTDLVQFLSQFGAVKTISQPQLTVLSGSSAELRVADTENFVSEIVTTIDEGQSTTSVSTDSVDTGFTLTIGSSWDKSTVYSNISLELTNVVDIEDFTFSDGGAGGTSTIIQLPQTSEREVTTQVRVRPGDSILLAGLVRETDNFNSSGPGAMKPFVPSSRTAKTQNLELVVLLRPRVVVYSGDDDVRYLAYVEDKNKKRVLKAAGAETGQVAPTRAEASDSFLAPASGAASSSASGAEPVDAIGSSAFDPTSAQGRKKEKELIANPDFVTRPGFAPYTESAQSRAPAPAPVAAPVPGLPPSFAPPLPPSPVMSPGASAPTSLAPASRLPSPLGSQGSQGSLPPRMPLAAPSTVTQPGVPSSVPPAPQQLPDLTAPPPSFYRPPSYQDVEQNPGASVYESYDYYIPGD